MAIIYNKKWGLEYSVEDKLVCGIELLGPEVKSLRQGLGSLDGARVLVRGGELELVACYIPIYQEKNNKGLDAYRTRKLLARKKEILKLAGIGTGSTLQIFPISLFWSGRKIKCEIGIGKKLNKRDKRMIIKERDSKRRDLE